MAQYRPYLEALENAPPQGFAPIGWLYTSIMENMLRDGLVWYAPHGAYRLSVEGARVLAQLRAEPDPQRPLGVLEMRQLSQAIRYRLLGIANELQTLEEHPRYDEDHKLERFPQITRAGFAKLDTLVDALEREFSAGIGSSGTVE